MNIIAILIASIISLPAKICSQSISEICKKACNSSYYVYEFQKTSCGNSCIIAYGTMQMDCLKKIKL